LNSVAGWAGLIDRSVAITAGASVSGGSLLRMTRFAPSGPCWLAGRYICQPAALSALLSRTLATMPITRTSSFPI
jgi:hypothetical protein